MIISHKYKFIFIKTRKTAGTSIEIFLSQFLGPDDIATPIYPSSDDHTPQNYRGWFNPLPELIVSPLSFYQRMQTIRDLVRYRKFYHHIPAHRVKTRLSPETYKDYFKFCVERNPWDKTLSYYYFQKNARGEHYTFDDYMARGDYCLNYPLYMDVQQKEVIVDKILKYENLSAELADVFDFLKIPFGGLLEVRAKSSYRETRKPYWEVLSREHIQELSNIFAKELELHGYSPQLAEVQEK